MVCGITVAVGLGYGRMPKGRLGKAINVGAVGSLPRILHRMAAIASGGLDTGPHNGAIITLLAVCGMTHRQSYPYFCHDGSENSHGGLSLGRSILINHGMGCPFLFARLYRKGIAFPVPGIQFCFTYLPLICAKFR